MTLSVLLLLLGVGSFALVVRRAASARRTRGPAVQWSYLQADARQTSTARGEGRRIGDCALHGRLYCASGDVEVWDALSSEALEAFERRLDSRNNGRGGT